LHILVVQEPLQVGDVVGRVQPHAVDPDPALPHLDRFAGQANEALHVNCARVRRVAEHNQVPAPRLDLLADEDPVARSHFLGDAPRRSDL
jgi:hypothetical protein